MEMSEGCYIQIQVVDAKKASYGVENATYAVVQLAQTTMRSELGKITLDKTFEERATLNLNIVESIRYGHLTILLCMLALIKVIHMTRAI